MGIVNATPDSFSDGGRDADYARQLLQDGADIIDIGGESTRPGASPVGVQQELDRVMPVIEALQGVPLSIDTFKPEVMAEAIRAGACMVNDINALQNESAMKLVANSQVAVCLMHKQGNPINMQLQPEYGNVVDEVREFLQKRIAEAVSAGIARDRILIDPGFGFGKTLEHNLALLRSLHLFADLGVPVLAGLSRKSMLGALTGQDAANRLSASVAAALIAVQKGAGVIRVHDVRATVDALKIWQAVNGGNG